jgi:hypothetical protein
VTVKPHENVVLYNVAWRHMGGFHLLFQDEFRPEECGNLLCRMMPHGQTLHVGGAPGRNAPVISTLSEERAQDLRFVRRSTQRVLLN